MSNCQSLMKFNVFKNIIMFLIEKMIKWDQKGLNFKFCSMNRKLKVKYRLLCMNCMKYYTNIKHNDCIVLSYIMFFIEFVILSIDKMSTTLQLDIYNYIVNEILPQR